MTKEQERELALSEALAILERRLLPGGDPDKWCLLDWRLHLFAKVVVRELGDRV